MQPLMTLTSRLSHREKGLTIAICTYNGQSRIKPTLEHILAQQNIDEIEWELIVIDNASTDGTTDFIKEHWPNERLHQLRIHREEKLGAIHARQRAIREARYSYLSYVDDDNWISANWVSEIYSIFKTHPSVALISCPSTAHLENDPPTYFEGLKGWLAVGNKCFQEGIIQDRPLSFWTAGLSIRLAAFNLLDSTSYAFCLNGRTGQQTYGGEDHELCLSITLMGWDVFYTNQASFVHDIPPTRLSEKYLEKLIQNGGKSREILDIYRNEYWRRKFYSPYLSIFEYFYYFCERFLKYWIKRFLGMATEPLNPNRVSYLHAIGRVKSYFIHFRRISQAQRNVRILRSIEPSFESISD